MSFWFHIQVSMGIWQQQQRINCITVLWFRFSLMCVGCCSGNILLILQNVWLNSIYLKPVSNETEFLFRSNKRYKYMGGRSYDAWMRENKTQMRGFTNFMVFSYLKKGLWDRTVCMCGDYSYIGDRPYNAHTHTLNEWKVSLFVSVKWLILDWIKSPMARV